MASSANDALRQRVFDRLGEVVDPCMEAAGLGLSLVDLGIVRTVNVSAGSVTVELGLTEPGCGFTHALVTRVEDALAGMDAIDKLQVTFNWTEPWTEALMTDAGRTVLTKARARGAGALIGFGGARRSGGRL